jgi:hypothetical protein
LAALTVTEALDGLDPVAAGGAALVAGVDVLVDVLVDEPHAAKRMEAPATATMGNAKTRYRL